jgi:hypothetical protein
LTNRGELIETFKWGDLNSTEIIEFYLDGDDLTVVFSEL